MASMCHECGRLCSRVARLLHRSPELGAAACWAEKRQVLRWLSIAEVFALCNIAAFMLLALLEPHGSRYRDVIFAVWFVLQFLLWTFCISRDLTGVNRGLVLQRSGFGIAKSFVLIALWLSSLMSCVVVPIALGVGNHWGVAWGMGVIAVLLFVIVARCEAALLRYAIVFDTRMTRRSRRILAKLCALTAFYIFLTASGLWQGVASSPALYLLPFVVPTMLRQLVPLVPARRAGASGL